MEKRILSKTSRTAELTCLTRAAAFRDRRPWQRCDDGIAPLLLPAPMQAAFRVPLLRYIYRAWMSPKGIYWYVVARSNYIDDAVRQAITGGIGQVVILGAGFDSRAIRFAVPAVHFFELDAPRTQEAKLRQYGRRGIEIPAGCRFIPIDLQTDSGETALTDAGFDTGAPAVFILEGLIMYLDEAAVDELFGSLSRLAAPGSLVVFDHVYAPVLRREGRYFGEEGIVKQVQKAGETWRSGIEEEGLEDFLSAQGFRLKDQADAWELEKRYYAKKDLAIRVNGTHRLVTAERMP